MRIFLTGPTGYIGGAVLDALMRAGHSVTGLVRDQPRARRLKKRGVEAVVGNLADSGWRDAAVGFDALIHTALDSQRGAQADAKALETLFSAAQSTGGHPRLVYTSFVWVLGATSAPADERTTLSPAAHSAWRPAHEQLVLRATGLTPVVVRPGIVYGGTRGIVGDLLRDAVNGLIRVIGDGRNRWATIYDRDLADLYVRLVTAPDVSGTYHATDEADESVLDIVEALSRNTTHKPDVRLMPIDEARAKLGTFADALAMDQVVRSPRARALGWMPSLRSIGGNMPRLLEEWRNGQKD
ncbi:MAG: NAD(P)H-binding protein [Vicinamibacteria bacterium]|nr:NAD(P)H-binding protein [Vicinamibacteria bacterium]